MFNFRFLDEIGKLVGIAKDNINSVSNSCKDILYSHVEACKNAIINHVAGVKDVLVGQIDLRSSGTNTHVTNEANSIRHYISSGLSPCIKTVQRGVTVFSNNSDYEVSVTISTITPSKSQVALFGSSGVLTSSNGVTQPYVVQLNPSTLVIGRNDTTHTDQSLFSWEVVEYY